MVVKVPINFPSQADVIYKMAVGFQRLSATEKLARIFEMSAFGESFSASPAHRDLGIRLRKAEKEKLRRILREVLKHHVA